MATPLAPVCNVVGAGLAGLAAAWALSRAGMRVRLFEAAAHAGGRCRSLPDQRFGTAIDNGSHLLFSGNHAALEFLRGIGAPSIGLTPRDGTEFLDLADNARWRIVPGGESALWMLGSGLKVPGVGRVCMLREGIRLLTAKPGERVGERVPTHGTAWRRFWKPFLSAVFNADPASVSAPHAADVLRALAMDGAAGGRPLQAARPWSEIVAEPALHHLRERGVDIRLGSPLLALDRGEGRVRRLVFRKGSVDSADEAVILAIPNAVAHRLCPDAVPEIPSAPIVNLHYQTDIDQGLGFCGIVGGIADWVFWRGGVVSATIAGGGPDLDPDALAATVWAEARRVLPKSVAALPPSWHRIVEKRATSAATPEAFRLRPKTVTAHPNLFLAGDWTDTGLPSTIECAVRSGFTAAQAVVAAAKA
jgi:hydroxysqualene dehydroxylase